MRAMLVTSILTYCDGEFGRPTPRDFAEGGLVRFLDRMAAAMPAGGTVLLAPDVCPVLGLPLELDPAADARQHPALAGPRAAGWEVPQLHRWARFTRAGVTISLGLLGLIDRGFCPLISPYWRTDTTRAMALWNEGAPLPYGGDPGQAFNTLLRHTGYGLLPDGRTHTEPQWFGGRQQPDGDPLESAGRSWTVPGWTPRPGTHLHTFDGVRAYLGTMTVTRVAAGPLRHRLVPFTPDLSGWWLVDLAPWTRHELLPHPAGLDEYTDPRAPVWLTTPTLELLDELTQGRAFGGFTVLDSWTSSGTETVLKPVATLLRQMWDTTAEHIRAQPSTAVAGAVAGAAVHATIKGSYQAGHGQWRSQSGRVQRPDWFSALVAQDRVNRWRRAWRIGRTHRVWPTQMHVDALVYESTEASAAAFARPLVGRGDRPMLPLVDPTDPATDRLGRFRTTTTEIPTSTERTIAA